MRIADRLEIYGIRVRIVHGEHIGPSEHIFKLTHGGARLRIVDFEGDLVTRSTGAFTEISRLTARATNREHGYAMRIQNREHDIATCERILDDAYKATGLRIEHLHFRAIKAEERTGELPFHG